MSSRRNTRGLIVACLVLIATTVFVFWPLARCEFINFDDPEYVKDNVQVRSGLTWPGLVWAFRSTDASNWHPLTWLSHMLDVELFGMNPAGHHLTSLSFHAANAVLLFLLLRYMTGALRRSAFVAALFALHPLHVESVAWISERKDVLSSFFFLLTLLAYVRYAQKSEVDSRQSELRLADADKQPWTSAFYWLALALFALGLMSKAMLVTLPFVLLLLDYWPLERMAVPTQPASHNSFTTLLKSGGFWRLVAEKTPFFIFSAACSVITFFAQKHGGAVESLDRLDLDARVAGALVACSAYIEKMIWPANLAIYYLRPPEWPEWRVIEAGLVVAGVSVAVLAFGRSKPYLRVGWLWFLGMLVPVIGLVQVGSQSMADRYTYLPLVGLFIMVAWGGHELMTRLPQSRWAAVCLGVLAVVGCAIVTRLQVNHWRNDLSLFTHCASVTKNNFVAHNRLGVTFALKGKLEEAEAEYSKAIEIQPNYFDALRNMGILLTEQGNIAQATNYLRKAVLLQSKNAEIWGHLGYALTAMGNPKAAIEYYHTALRLRPESVETLNNLAWILATQPDEGLRNGTEAVVLAENACTLTGYKQAVFVGTLAAAYAEAGRFDDAIKAAEQATALAAEAEQGAATSGQKEIKRQNQELARQNEELLMLYHAGKPYRDAPKPGATPSRANRQN